MCKEVDAFLEDIRELDATEARELLAEYESVSEVFVELKGISIARAVKEHISLGEIPVPTLLALCNTETYPGRLTKGFLKYLGVASIEDISNSAEIDGWEVGFESITRPSEMTSRERTFHQDHISLPAVRVGFTNPSVTASETV